MPCTKCGHTDEHCSCTKTVDFEDLNYTYNQFEVPDMLVRQPISIKRRYGDALRAWEDICDTRPTGAKVRWAHFWAVTSVQTRSALLDSLTDIPKGDFKALKNGVSGSTDGNLKWEKVHDIWTGDTADTVAESLQAGDWVQAVADLSGHQRGFHARTEENYARTVKSHVVTEIFGDPDALCLDSARRSVLEPLFERMFHPRTRGTHLGTGGEFRGQAVPATADKVFPGSKTFIEDRLAYNPREYRAIARRILDELTDATGMSRREVSHALFILGSQDGATEHESLARLIA